MSDIPVDYRDRLNLRDEIARIDRNRADSQKLEEEGRKFVTEQRKLIAETSKLDRDRWLAPWALVASLFGALLGGVVVAVISHFWH